MLWVCSITDEKCIGLISSAKISAVAWGIEECYWEQVRSWLWSGTLQVSLTKVMTLLILVMFILVLLELSQQVCSKCRLWSFLWNRIGTVHEYLPPRHLDSPSPAISSFCDGESFFLNIKHRVDFFRVVGGSTVQKFSLAKGRPICIKFSTCTKMSSLVVSNQVSTSSTSLPNIHLCDCILCVKFASQYKLFHSHALLWKFKWFHV